MIDLITKVKLNNFKSIKDHDEIELRPLTIITGPNSSGKSNLLEGIGIFTQRARLSAGPWNLRSIISRGDLFTYPKVDFIAHRKELSRPITFKLEFELPESDQAILETKTQRIGYETRYIPKTFELSQSIFLGERKIVETTVKRTKEGLHESKFTVPRFLRRFPPKQTPNQILNDAVFSPIVDESLNREDSYTLGSILRNARLANAVLLRRMSRVFFISAIRGEVPISPTTGKVPSWVGKNGQYTLSLLAMIFSKREYRRIAEQIILWAKKFGFANLGGGWWGEDQIGVDYVDPESKKALELALASQGSRQALTLITQLCWEQKGDVLMVEEPEISLHPEHQLILQEFFGEIASEGKQVICTTHSPIFVLGLSKILKSGILSKKDVKVLHTEKTEKGTKFTPLPLTKDGYVKGWIPSFTGAEDKLLKEWSETIGD